MISWWEKNSFLNYDIVVIGSGITGLSCAASLKEKHPNLSILVLERGTFPSGASTKNAGFACFGSLTELIADLDHVSETEMVDLVKLRWNGLQKLISRLGKPKIGYLNQGGYEMITEKEIYCLDKIDKINNLLCSNFASDVFELTDHKIQEFGFSPTAVKHLVYNRYESQIDTGEMMKNLIAYCSQLGIQILNGIGVIALNEADNSVAVETTDGITFTVKQVAVCTNAFSRNLLPDLQLKPGRGMVLITEPIPNLPIKGTFHYDEGFYYFRDYNERIIFGGGRNIDFETETTTDFEINTQIKTKLIELLDEVILPKTNYKIHHEWVGIMAFGETKEPIVKKHSDRISIGVRMGGMGVAIGSMIGEQIAEMLLSEM